MRVGTRCSSLPLMRRKCPKLSPHVLGGFLGFGGWEAKEQGGRGRGPVGVVVVVDGGGDGRERGNLW